MVSHFAVHDVQPLSSANFNTSHRIRHLSFGKNIPGKTNPIDGTDVITHEGKVAFGFSVYVIPNYCSNSGLPLQTCVRNYQEMTTKQYSDISHEEWMIIQVFVY